MHQERSYVLALEGAGNIRGMYIGDGPDALSFRQFGKYLLLKDLVCERENPYTEVFTPSRFSAEEIPQIAKDSRRAVKGLAKRFFHLPGDTINMIEPGHAAVVETPGGRAGVYKSEDNQIYQVDVVCPHLGCRLAWNQDERSWDCPCHGSRFDYKGNLLDGPAQEGICLGGEVREGDK